MASNDQHRISELQRQNDFLRDKVQRLNFELGRYQTKMGGLPAHEGEIDPMPPWLTDESVISPLLTAYDERLRQCEEQINFYKEELQTLQQRSLSIVEENDQLHGELKAQLEVTASIEGMLGSGGGGNGPCSKEDWEDAQERLELLTEENDTLLEQQRKNTEEVDRLLEEVTARTRDCLRATKEMDTARVQVRQLQDELQAKEGDLKLKEMEADSFNNENEATRAEMGRLRETLKAHQQTVDELRQLLVEVTAQRDSLTRDGNLMASREQELLNVAAGMERDLEEAKERQDEAERELKSLKKERDELVKALAAYEQRLSEGEEHREDAYRHSQHTLKLVEEAQLQRDQAVLAMNRARKENEHLNERLTVQAGELSTQYQVQVDGVKDKLAALQTSTNARIRELERANAGLEQAVLREKREKDRAKEDLDRHEREEPATLSRFEGMVSTLTSKLRAAQQECAIAIQDKEAASQDMSRITHVYNAERASLESRLNEIERRFALLQKAHYITTEELATVTAQYESQEQGGDGSGGDVQDLHDHIAVLQDKLMSERKLREETRVQLSELIGAQAKLGNQWKEESLATTAQLRGVLDVSNKELTTLRDENRRLEDRLSRVRMTPSPRKLV